MSEQDEIRIKQIIDEGKEPYLLYGGGVEYVGIKDDKVLIKTEGYCHR